MAWAAGLAAWGKCLDSEQKGHSAAVAQGQTKVLTAAALLLHTKAYSLRDLCHSCRAKHTCFIIFKINAVLMTSLVGLVLAGRF